MTPSRSPIPGRPARLRRLAGLLLLTATLSAAVGAAGAQSAPNGAAAATANHQVAAAASKAGILLRWFAPGDLLPQQGFVVVRTGGGRTTRIDVPSPMPEQQALGRGYADSDSYAYLTELFSPAFGTGLSDSDRAFARAIGLLQTVAHPDLARALGLLIEDRDVTPGVRYTYDVRVAGGRDIGSVQVVAGRPALLAQATGLRASFAAGAVHLSWDRPGRDSLVTAFDVYRRDPDGSEHKLTSDPLVLPSNAAPDTGGFFRDSSARAGRRYVYRVVGIDLFGRRAASSDPLPFAVPDLRPLPQLAIGSDDVLDKAIRLHWQAPGDARVEGIAVLRTTDPARRPTQITVQPLAPGATSYLDEAVQGGVDYYYALATVDADGRLGPLSPLWAERGADFQPPGAPTDLRLSATPTHIDLTWSAPPEKDVASYRVYAGRDPGGPLSSYQLIGQVTATRFSQPVPANSLDGYSFRVTAVNATDVAGRPSVTVTGRVVDRTPPPAPALTDITAADGSISLRWAGNANPDVYGYRLERAAGSGAFTQVGGDLPPTQTSYEDDAVTPGTGYRYRVTAVDGAGNVSEPSQPLQATAFSLSGPGTVSGLTAVAGKGGVRLAWKALASSGTRYAVERSHAGGPYLQISDPVPAPSYLDATGVASDSYRVVAVGAGGRIGDPSPAVEAAAAP